MGSFVCTRFAQRTSNNKAQTREFLRQNAIHCVCSTVQIHHFSDRQILKILNTFFVGRKKMVFAISQSAGVNEPKPNKYTHHMKWCLWLPVVGKEKIELRSNDVFLFFGLSEQWRNADSFCVQFTRRSLPICAMCSKMCVIRSNCQPL